MAVALLALLAGLAGGVQVAVMSRFGEKIGIPAALAFSTVVTSVIALGLLLVTRRSLAGFGDAVRQPPWLWIGGVMGVFIVFTITFAAPRIGSFATIGIMIAGQLAMGAAIDRWGLFGLERIPLTAMRVFGLVLLGAGAVLTLRKV
jgi:transporter family-2 protein